MDFLGTVQKLSEAEGLKIEYMDARVLGVRVFINGRMQTAFGKYRCKRAWVDPSNRMLGIKIVSEHIELNRLVMRDEDSYRDTLAHEIGHAMTPGEKHNWKWQQAVKAIGGNPVRLATMEESARIGISDKIISRIRVVATCEKCGYELRRQRALRIGRVFTHSCGGRMRPTY